MEQFSLGQFNLEEYLKNPDREIFTRKGQQARIVCTNRKTGTCDNRDVVALVYRDNVPFCKEPHEEVVFVHGDTGRCFTNQTDQDDLFFGPKKHTGWINVYKEGSGHETSRIVYESKKEAINNVARFGTLVATIQIEWEE